MGSMTFRHFDQHGRLLSGRIVVYAVEVLNLGGVGLIARPTLVFEIDGLGGRRPQGARGHCSRTGNRKAKQIASVDNCLEALLHQGRTPKSSCCPTARTA